MQFEWNSCFSILSSQTLEIVYCPSYILTNKKNLSGFLVSHNAPFHTTITMLLHNTFSTNCLKYFFLYSFICIFSFSFFFLFFVCIVFHTLILFFIYFLQTYSDIFFYRQCLVLITSHLCDLFLISFKQCLPVFS